MKQLKVYVLRAPILGRLWLIISRAKTPLHYYKNQFCLLGKWLIKSKETTNYTYDLQETNKRYLASFVADIANIDFEQSLGYVKEVEDDEGLRNHIIQTTSKSDLAFVADRDVWFGRRLGWYALTRATKPKIVIETGVDKGLGACLLASAIRKNVLEGHEGYYYGTDINQRAGYLLSGIYAEYGKILYGDSLKTLLEFDKDIDLFINDSDHSAQYEASEYHAIKNKLSENAILLGDNSHATEELLNFSIDTGRSFQYFQEKPLNHWYPGAGIGISFIRKKNSQPEPFH